MAWTDAVDAYCERVGAGLWNEPLNALSNIAFLLAALALWRFLGRMRAQGRVAPPDARLLPPLVLLVGVASLLFHTLATRWAGLLDTLFILLFCCVFLYGFLRHAAAAPVWLASAGAIAFAAVSYAFPRAFVPGALNGSLGYFPNLAGLLAMSAWLAWRRAPAARMFGLASAVFCIALLLRTLDLDLCVRFTVGTHFVWHLLNGLLLWLLAREMMLQRFAPGGTEA
jgi:hypothetical protein